MAHPKMSLAEVEAILAKALGYERADIDFSWRADISEIYGVDWESKKEPSTTRAFVVMGNDYPAGIGTTEAAATKVMERCKKNHDERAKSMGRTPMVYWRLYEFPLEGE